MVTMPGERLIILDLTGAVPRAAADGDPLDIFDIPADVLRVAIRADPESPPPGLVARAGAESAEWLEDDRTLVVEKTVERAPMIEDAELQTRLLRAVWGAVRRDIEPRSRTRRVLSFVVPPANYPVELLERWRRSSA